MELDRAIATMKRLIDGFEALRVEVTTKDPCSLRHVPDAKELNLIQAGADDIIEWLKYGVNEAEAIQELFAEIQTRRRVS